MNIDAILFGLTIGLLISFVALGFALTFSVLKFVNFAHSDLLTVGAYLTWVCAHTLGLNLVFASVIGVTVTGLIGVCMERLVFRPLRNKRLSMFVSSLGISLVINALITMWFGSSSRILASSLNTVSLGSVRLTYPEVLAICLSVALFLLISVALRRTQYGLAIRAIAENWEGVAALGIPCNRLVSVTFFISSSLAASAGVFLGLMHDVTPQMGQRYGIWAFAIVVVAGLGNLSGIPATALLAGVVIALVISSVGSFTYVNVVLFGLMTVILLTRPDGLFGIRLRRL